MKPNPIIPAARYRGKTVVACFRISLPINHINNKPPTYGKNTRSWFRRSNLINEGIIVLYMIPPLIYRQKIRAESKRRILYGVFLSPGGIFFPSVDSRQALAGIIAQAKGRQTRHKRKLAGKNRERKLKTI